MSAQNGKAISVEDLYQQIDGIDQRFTERADDFGKRWWSHRQEAKSAMAQLAALQTHMSAISAQTANLSTLPHMAGLLGEIKDKLIVPATDKTQQTKLFFWMFGFMFFVLLIMGSLLVIQQIKSTNTSVEVGGGGFKINSTTGRADGKSESAQ